MSHVVEGKLNAVGEFEARSQSREDDVERTRVVDLLHALTWRRRVPIQDTTDASAH